MTRTAPPDASGGGRTITDYRVTLAETTRFFARAPQAEPGGRRLLPASIVVTLADGGQILLPFDPPAAVRAGNFPPDQRGIVLSAEDWLDLLDGTVTAADLWATGRLRTIASETWRGEYARLFNLIRLTREQ